MTNLVLPAGLLLHVLMCLLAESSRGAEVDSPTVAGLDDGEELTAKNFRVLKERLNTLETFLLSDAAPSVEHGTSEQVREQVKHLGGSHGKNMAALTDRLNRLELASADAHDRLRLLEVAATGAAQPSGWSAGQLLLLILAAIATLAHGQSGDQLKDSKNKLATEGMMDAERRNSGDFVKDSVDTLAAQDEKETEPDQMMSTVMPVWELERRTTIWQQDWRAPFLPHDVQKASKWMGIQDRYIPHPLVFSNVSNTEDAARCETPPIKEVTFPGCTLSCNWEVQVDETSDLDGWQYSFDFYIDDSRWGNRPGGFSHVRRRKWKPIFSTKEVSAESDSQQPPQPVRHSMQSALIADNALPPPRVVLEADLGVVPLHLLASNLEAEDWSDAENVMMMYFDNAGIQIQQIGHWTAGVESDYKVQGKLRSVDMKVPVPPSPICPAESRCVSTWHVASNEGTVTLESIVMTLDVPYGKSFNVVKNDLFTLDRENGHTKMVRTISFDWVKSCWAKSMVESQVPKELHKDAEQWAMIVKRWAARVAT